MHIVSQQSLGIEESLIRCEGRLEEDFVIKEVICESETAVVVKCMNKLDRMDYAVKIYKKTKR